MYSFCPYAATSVLVFTILILNSTACVQYLTAARGISQRREIPIGRRVQYYQEAAALCKASPLSEETQILLGNMDQKLEV
jgi:hypothetical protein